MAPPKRKRSLIDPAEVRKVQEENGCTLQEAVAIVNGRTLPENADKGGKGSRLERAICLAYAKGCLPSLIAGELEMSAEEVDEKLEQNKEHIERLVDILGSDYQQIRLNNISDHGIRKMEEIALDPDSSHKDVMDILKDMIKWRKDGDLDKIFSNRSLDETFLNVPDDVQTLDEAIKEKQERIRKLGGNLG